MENRTMVKIQAGSSGVSVRTVSRSFKSPRSIFIEKERLWELQEKGRCTVRDGLPTADMSRHGLSSGEDCIKVFFIWLEGTGEGEIKGCTEQICLPCGKFLEYATACMQDGKERRLLSVSERSTPKIEFLSRRRLREVAENKTIRKKFGRFLDRKLSRLRYKRIVLSDESEPFSFGFTCYTAEGAGLCGGIILHRQGSLESASYGMHT